MELLSNVTPLCRSRSSSSCRWWCSSTSSATTWSRGGTASGSRSSRSASGRSCSASTTATAPAGRSAPCRSAATSRCLATRTRRAPTVDLDDGRGARQLPEPGRWPQRMAIVVGRADGQLRLRDRRCSAVCSRQSASPFTPAVVGEVEPGSAADAAGLQPGDRIVAVDGTPIASFEDLQGVVSGSAGRDADLHDRARWQGPVGPEGHAAA